MTRQSLWQPTSGPSSLRRSSTRQTLLFLLTKETTGIPEAEATTLVRDIDPMARFETPEEGLLLAETCTTVSLIEPRVAFARRVGALVPDGELDDGDLATLRNGTYRVRVFGASTHDEERAVISSLAERIGGRVSLESPDREVTAYVSKETGRRYLALTAPMAMRQGWATRRPRSRAYFHPSAIFPKLSRALVNLSGIQPGEAFLDPFCGTGSLLIEASLIGADPVGIDIARKMVRGARRNSLKYGQPWLGVVRADSRRMPVARIGGMSTDVPYGRAASAGGARSGELLTSLVDVARDVLPKGRKLVVMHPKTLPVAAAGLIVEMELEMYVHRTLTRTITVMRSR